MRHRMPGLDPRNLAHYLAAVGLGRILAEQADPGVRWGWDGLELVVETTVEDVPRWLVHDYRPTPVLSPWNNGSGYGPKDKTPREFVDRILASDAPRLKAFVDVDAVGRQARETHGGDKEAIVQHLRNWLPDEGLSWLDAAIVLTEDRDRAVLRFPPLLGSGGNDGRLDFSTTFHQALASVLPELGAAAASSTARVRDLLVGTSTTRLTPKSQGQFDALAAGGMGSSASDSTAALANPWSFILLVEGAMLFAAVPARRLGEAAGRASLPFTVHGSPFGPGEGSPEEEVRGEIWAPMVSAPQRGGGTTWTEWQDLFHQAKARWGGRTATTATEMYGAIHAQGADRRVERFARFALPQRNGLAFMAQFRELVENRPDPGGEVALEISRRLRCFRSVPGVAARTALRRAERALLELTRRGTPDSMVQALAALTLVEMNARRTPRGRESIGFLSPLPRWETVRRLAPGAETNPEGLALWAVGVGLASGRTPPPEGGSRRETLRDLVLGREVDGHWVGPLAHGLEEGDLPRLFAGVAGWLSSHGSDREVARGIRPFVDHTAPPGVTPTEQARLLHAWVRGELDERALTWVVTAMLSVDFDHAGSTADSRSAAGGGLPMPWSEPGLAVLQAFAGAEVTSSAPAGAQASRGGRRALSTEWLGVLALGSPAGTARVLTQATTVLNRSTLMTRRSSSVPAPRFHLAVPAITPDGRRLAAALLGPAGAAPVVRWAQRPEARPAGGVSPATELTASPDESTL